MQIWTLAMAATIVLAILSRTGAALCAALAAGGFLWICATGALTRALTWLLENRIAFRSIDDAPKADAIVVLGGGVLRKSRHYPYPRMGGAADRVFHAARLWRCGKAPIILTSGSGEFEASYPFLLEIGLPPSAILVENESGDTEENARESVRLLRGRARTIILVTSAWHMRRALLLFKIFAPDFDVIPSSAGRPVPRGGPLRFPSLLPTAGCLVQNGVLIKECLGCLWYKLVKVEVASC